MIWIQSRTQYALSWSKDFVPAPIERINALTDTQLLSIELASSGSHDNTWANRNRLRNTTPGDIRKNMLLERENLISVLGKSENRRLSDWRDWEKFPHLLATDAVIPADVTFTISWKGLFSDVSQELYRCQSDLASTSALLAALPQFEKRDKAINLRLALVFLAVTAVALVFAWHSYVRYP